MTVIEQVKCRHEITRVLQPNALGVTVGCIKCDTTFDVPYENVERYFLTFHHNSNRGPREDITLLIRRRVLE